MCVVHNNRNTETLAGVPPKGKAESAVVGCWVSRGFIYIRQVNS